MAGSVGRLSGVDPTTSSVGLEEVQDVERSKVTSIPRARSAGKKLMLFCSGSRGDMQPFIALSDAFQKAGFNVLVGTNSDHVSFVKAFGLEPVSLYMDLEKAISEPLCEKAMAEGDAFAFIAWMGKKNAEGFPDAVTKIDIAVDAFKPEILIATPLTAYEVNLFGRAKSIPTIRAALQVAAASKYLPSMLNEPSCFPHRMCGTLLMYLGFKQSTKVKLPELIKKLPATKGFAFQSFREAMLYTYHPTEPIIVGISPLLNPVYPDWPEDYRSQTYFTGFWVVGKEEQKNMIQRRDSKFGGAAMPELKNFLAKVGKPAYIGWGSMLSKSPEHMACLAVRALMKANKSGIILGGWAKLSVDNIEGQSDTEAMKDYCKDRVLFMKSAPHEWLFPQCSVTVHHGGAGTTAAALRAGVPTIITPCLLDQFPNGLTVQNNGLGIRTCQLGKLTVSELAKAITTCTADKQMIEKASAMGEKLQAENGLATAVKVLDDWIMEELDTGKHAARLEQRSKEISKLRSRAPPGCLSWVARMCCSCNGIDYSVKL